MVCPPLTSIHSSRDDTANTTNTNNLHDTVSDRHSEQSQESWQSHGSAYSSPHTPHTHAEFTNFPTGHGSGGVGAEFNRASYSANPQDFEEEMTSKSSQKGDSGIDIDRGGGELVQTNNPHNKVLTTDL